MGTKLWEGFCDEHGIGGDGEYCGSKRRAARPYQLRPFFENFGVETFIC
jgi:hypothetical protein